MDLSASVGRLPPRENIMVSTLSLGQGAALAEPPKPPNAGQKFYVNIEGTEYEWPKDTITVPEIRTLGNLPPDQPVISEDPQGTERTLKEDEIVTIKPGHRIGRAPKYKRG